MKAYILDEDTLSDLYTIAALLQGDHDKYRDIGHKLWLITSSIEDNLVKE